MHSCALREWSSRGVVVGSTPVVELPFGSLHLVRVIQAVGVSLSDACRFVILAKKGERFS